MASRPLVGAASLEPVDAVVLYIGQNDQASLGGQFMDSDTQLLGGFIALLQQIRFVRGENAKIVVIAPSLDAVVDCVCTERGHRITAETQNRVWKQAVEQLGGEERHYYLIENRHEPQIQVSGRGQFGLMLHWNAKSHKALQTMTWWRD